MKLPLLHIIMSLASCETPPSQQNKKRQVYPNREMQYLSWPLGSFRIGRKQKIISYTGNYYIFFHGLCAVPSATSSLSRTVSSDLALWHGAKAHCPLSSSTAPQSQP